MIKSGASLNANVYGETPLMLAVQYGQIKAVKILIAAGADINAEHPSGNTILMIARRYQNDDKTKIEYGKIIKLLEAAGAK